MGTGKLLRRVKNHALMIGNVFSSSEVLAVRHVMPLNANIVKHTRCSSPLDATLRACNQSPFILHVSKAMN